MDGTATTALELEPLRITIDAGIREVAVCYGADVSECEAVKK